MDYSKWDKLEREIQEEEEAQEFMEREARKQKYLREQELKRKQYVEKYGKEPPKSSCCGSADPNKILNNQKKHAHGDCSSEIPLAEKNEKKKAAVLAAKEDANRLFKEGNYSDAYKVYERGALIINGMYGLSDSEYDEMFDIEMLLDLNMAATKLKMNDPVGAISHCKMALNHDKKCTKAHYRMAQAYFSLGELEKAMASLELIASDKSNEPQVRKLKDQILSGLSKQREKELLSRKAFASNLAL